MKKGWKVGMNTSRASSRDTEDLGTHGGRTRRLERLEIKFKEDGKGHGKV